MLYCVNFGVKPCNMFLNLNYACSCVLVIFYPFHILFMQICMCKCVKIIGICFLVNMLSLKKLDVPVLETRCSGFCAFADKKWMIRFLKPDCPILADLAYVSPNFNCCDPPVMCIT
jgi:hypothetical protein